MNVYKYVKILEPDCYYGGPDEEILFYCTDENKDNKINETLKRCLKKINQHYKLEFEKNKSYQHCEIFTNETIDIIVYFYKNEYTLFDKSKYSLSNFYYINNCHGYIEELCITDRNEKTGYRNEKLETITELHASRCYPDCKREGHRSCRGQWFADADDRTFDFEPATDQRDGGQF